MSSWCLISLDRRYVQLVSNFVGQTVCPVGVYYRHSQRFGPFGKFSMGHWVSYCQLFEAASRASSTKFLDCSALEDEDIPFSETSKTLSNDTSDC